MALFDKYTSEKFNSLPFLGESSKAFQSIGDKEALFSDLKDLFIRYGVTDLLGLTLVHRHFDVNEDELLVESNGTTMPWTVPGLASFCDDDGTIKPQSWAFLHGRLMPFEFFFEPSFSSPKDPRVDLLSGVDSAFFHEFESVLRQRHLDNTLGLCLLSRCPQPQIEITRGRANITFNVSEDNYRNARGEFTEVVWACTEATPGVAEFTGTKKCKKVATTSSKAAHACMF
ncbi:hypothetical protein IFM51744_09792 [Aspergillus udagawae]|uniref:Uncharacterized protein n=1 Tax=Aspergillus udagawae TaxID=91492 RepID=A0ABQ1BFF7_9EURO|nr:hypothetical protein IFM51744_09792 [Aspergillus udagawae]GFG01071.1 hypothetical protein IFM53868_10929 [Aspergillus udagawae]